MKPFVNKNSIVREIWGKSDTILFVFAGASAEFALNKAVDWLYYTGKLPKDPLGRLFSTVAYARHIVFSDESTAYQSIDMINKIHQNVEYSRQMNIPDWAYKDVLFMLIDYSIRSYEMLERKLSLKEKEDVLEVFNRVGTRMNIKDLPPTFEKFEKMRLQHMESDLQFAVYTQDLYNQYRKHLGWLRYKLLLEVQIKLLPTPVRSKLNLRKHSFIGITLIAYKWSRLLRIDWFIKELILPSEYKPNIKALDQMAA
ncbi:DUF2236 domain-containing protein [Mangrovimonas sp. AS39]|uniref:oxygenase MpaB family protein n=1 Tax=Mangrovimonas futianensis TaxID=2895523 RepID=UPI001E64558D|nr:oxygenase MpaB family protein [Mangrovimonas futianensis]MCF1191425.1 DUF2236 domain-containing protein [Mangrovimonas futianensis]MCF1195120.1 DUF2236 domain-containing protein [Mangrovimonas futianensis]